MRKILLPPVVFALCLTGIIVANIYDLIPIALLSGPIRYGGVILILPGLALPLWGARLFRRHQTNIVPYKKPDRIVTTGPFRWSRNPMYLGLLLLLLGVAMLYTTAFSFVFPLVFFLIANRWYIPYEEERMHEAFGDAFLSYKARVRRWL
ncbi:MAG: isoprenylcysteine carboxylmethyltransferase family protein [Alphaproteobacteria bacterium]|nr:isoprenylcysteine carboxylmethyltransferase family protein [Alphaproteobacteria bacterium]